MKKARSVFHMENRRLEEIIKLFVEIRIVSVKKNKLFLNDSDLIKVDLIFFELNSYWCY